MKAAPPLVNHLVTSHRSCNTRPLLRLPLAHGQVITFHSFLWDVITHPCPNINNILAKPLLKLMYGWELASYDAFLSREDIERIHGCGYS